MKKLVMMTLLIVICAAGTARAADANDLRKHTRDFRKELGELVKLRDEFLKKPDKGQKQVKAAYQQQAGYLLAGVREHHRLLEESINSYLAELEGPERVRLEESFQSELNIIQTEIGKLDQQIQQGNVSATVMVAEPLLRTALDTIDNLPKRTRQGLSPTPTPSDPRSAREPDYLLYLLTLLVALLGAAAIFWLHGRLQHMGQLLHRQNDELGQLRSHFNENAGHEQQIQQRIEYEAKAVWQDFLAQRSRDLEHQQHLFNELRAEFGQRPPTGARSAARSLEPEPAIIRTREEIVERTPRAPVTASANEYLNRAGGRGIPVKSVLFRPEVLQPADGDGLYLVVPVDGQHNCYEVIPGVPRFGGAQDFSHFSHFYDCDQPSAGEVIILEPALATYDEAAGQWTRRHKGRLQTG